MFSSVFDDGSQSCTSSLEYVINHVLSPLNHPQHDYDYTPKNVHTLVCAVQAAARAYSQHVDDFHEHHWPHITKMLENMQTITKHTQPWNEVSRRELALDSHTQQQFQDHIISQFQGMKPGDFLAFPGRRYQGVTMFRKHNQSTLYEWFPVPGHPSENKVVGPELAIEFSNQVFNDEYFRSELSWFLSAQNPSVCVFHAAGYPVVPLYITKQYSQCFRMGLWFVIKVAIQSSLDRSTVGHATYKTFMLFFMCNLAMHAINTYLPSVVLHSMSVKILRRFRKLPYSSVPQWFYDTVSNTCASLSRILDQRWQRQLTPSSSPSWDLAQLDLAKDIHPSLTSVRKYILSPLENSPHVPFLPSCHFQGTLVDLLSRPEMSSSYEDTRVQVTHYDVEHAVREDIDDWTASVTNVDEASEQVENLVFEYQSLTLGTYGRGGHTYDPEHHSVMLLTMIELWIALDKLVIKQFPILTDYSPEVPTDLLCKLILHDATSVHRLCRAHQYLLARHNQARPGCSAFMHPSAEDSFPCRYYDGSPYLQRLRIYLANALPSAPLDAKAAVFELRCPASFDRWRSLTCRIPCASLLTDRPENDDIPVCAIPELQPFTSIHRRSVLLYSGYPRWDGLYYAYQGPRLNHVVPVYKLPNGPYAESGLQQYVSDTTHTSNEILASQANCHPDIPSHEFISFAHLRSAGSLQWFNILRELRSGSLNVRHKDVFLLLAQATSHVGPFNNNTGGSLWHQEVEDTLFCHALLDELEILFTDAGVGSLDGTAMAIISLLAGVLASKSSSIDISEQAIQLLRRVREKTFDWLHELLYNMRTSLFNKDSLELLRDMATICRSTFDVGPAMSHKLLQPPQNIEAALSCAMIIRTAGLPPSSGMSNTCDLCQHHRSRLLRYSNVLDAIQADVSDTGVDRAVQMVWPDYRPSSRRWESLDPPSSRWLVCEAAPNPGTTGTRSRTVYINLLDGSLLVDGKAIGYELPSCITNNSMYCELFGNRDLMFVASDLPGMDYVTLVQNHQVHFAVRKDSRNNEKVIVRTKNKDADDVLELIPREELLMDLPHSLVENHVHWLNLHTSVIEIRPVHEPWKQSLDNWTIHLSGRPRVTKQREFLVDKQSRTWAMISNCFQCLDAPENLVITAIPVDNSCRISSLRLFLTLPRYDLSFFLNDSKNFESRDFKDMVYDKDQCVGTLFGLKNRLVLCPKVQLEEDLVPKLIIIPSGDVDAAQDYRKQVLFHTYKVDKELGCLKGTSLESRLHLAHLHALTGSGCRRDPLTGRTGVEEAISLIWLAGTRQQSCLPSWCAESQSFQIRSASESVKISGITTDRLEFPSERDLLRAIRLFPSEVAPEIQLSRKGPLASLVQLFHERPVPDLQERDILPAQHHHPGFSGFSGSPNVAPLRQLFSSLRATEKAPPFQSQYISRLHNSVHHFLTSDAIRTAWWSCNGNLTTQRLRKHYVQCRINYVDGLNTVRKALGPKTEFEHLLDQYGQWPRITPFILFRCLASTSPVKLPEGWKKCLISLALLALGVQRARRLLQFALDGLEEELGKELENEPYDGWDATDQLDWLLIQLEGNFVIRRVQVDVAKEMMAPRSGQNTVIQVNMGEGKTSVIIPICAAALADGDQLVRVIVPKASIPHTLQILTDRLCGLVGRPVYRLTFSRGDVSDSDCSESKVERLQTLLRSYKNARGIVVAQPEHVLSLKLACVEMQLVRSRRMFTTPIIKYWDSESLTVSPATSRILELQRFLSIHVRDILDESDDVLRPQFQLIYATGRQHPFDGSPDRWVITQQVLGLVKRHAHIFSTPYSHTIQCFSHSPGSFPHIHELQANGGEELVSLIVQDVLDGRLSSLSFHSELGLRGAIREFVLRKDGDIHPDTAKTVERFARQTTGWSSLLLLRGLLAQNILWFALTQRRWRVDYGLDPSFPPRTMLAIPYRAKDVPTEVAEFGHPDVAILLTCLSYYYGGLSEDQLGIAFELLLQKDDPASEYTFWLEDCDTASVPNVLQKLDGVNVESLQQWTKYIVPLFARNKRAIDLYLSKVVFPKHAKQFPQKISGSYWDIAERRNHPITGFSGTDDGQYLLPTSIVQDNPEHLHQAGTNARILSYLLQQENSSYMVTSDENGERWTTLKLLEIVVAQNPEIHVLLDVGAQILDLSNIELAKAWLGCTLVTQIAGAVYFSEDDRLMVLTRSGTTQPLSSSPLSGQLHRCVVYLDDAHTRGTDIKFPVGFRAAVTLGHKVTKDRLVQGCMRMRKLGQGHSVMFLAPHEVDQRIRCLVAKDNNIPVTTADILHWAIHETWSDIQRQAPYWARHGMDHQSRYEAWSRFCQNEATLHKLAESWIQPELKSLADMYMPCDSAGATSSAKLPRQIRERCENLGVLSVRDVRMDEEQEREVSREIERERQAQNHPPKTFPANHFLHPDVRVFVKTGVVPPSSRAFRPVFATGTTAASGGLHPWSPYVFATADFSKTTRASKSVRGELNHYIRPVQFVISGKMHGRDALLLVSPFEADQLMPDIRDSKHVHLHLYAPRTAKRMKPADDLRLYSVPPLPSNWTPPWPLIDQLNIFAGQLYLSDYASYLRVCRFLGVHTDDLPQNAGTVVARNWFGNPDAFGDAEIRNRLEGTSLPFAMQMLVARRGMQLGGTHMGRILDGLPLTKADFETPSSWAKPLTFGGLDKQCGASAKSVSVDKTKEEECGMTRKRVSHSELGGSHSKHERPNF